MGNFKYDISQYKLKRKLGKGGMATVYLAENTKFRTDVAIKFLNVEYTHNENIRKRFLAEARSMFKMSHPNIVRVTDLVEEGRMVAFVMEYIDGKTLKEELESSHELNNEAIKKLFLQMLDAVDYVHQAGFIHRDIKPSNFMLTKDENIKLLDFGIAKNTEKDKEEYTVTGTNSVLGTPLYMSPEQIKSTKAVTYQSDVYSLGVVLWEMVMGKKPYNAKTISTFELQTKIVNETLPTTNTNWDRLIKKATENDLPKRYTSVLELAKEVLELDFSVPTPQEGRPSVRPTAPSVLPTTPLQESPLKKAATSLNAAPFSTNYVINKNQNQNKKRNQGNALRSKSKTKQKIAFSVLAAILILVGVKSVYSYQRSAVMAEIEESLVLVKGGSFNMGCRSSYRSNYNSFERCEADEQPLHTIQLDDYSIGKFEVTQSQWEGIMGAKDFHFEGCDDCPAEMVSWVEVQEFLNIISHHTGQTYRLPTEAEWEYAARNGQEDYLSARNQDLDEVAWYRDNSGQKTHPVGKKQPNELGIYDLTGNVREWCGDWYGETYYADVAPNTKNPKGPSSRSSTSPGKVLRGASWGSETSTKRDRENTCRILKRWYTDEKKGNKYNGFRVVRESQ